jgi:hypothetical protein
MGEHANKQPVAADKGRSMLAELIHAAVRSAIEAAVEAEFAATLGAGRYECRDSAARTNIVTATPVACRIPTPCLMHYLIAGSRGPKALRFSRVGLPIPVRQSLAQGGSGFGAHSFRRISAGEADGHSGCPRAEGTLKQGPRALIDLIVAEGIQDSWKTPASSSRRPRSPPWNRDRPALIRLARRSRIRDRRLSMAAERLRERPEKRTTALRRGAGGRSADVRPRLGSGTLLRGRARHCDRRTGRLAGRGPTSSR